MLIVVLVVIIVPVQIVVPLIIVVPLTIVLPVIVVVLVAHMSVELFVCVCVSKTTLHLPFHTARCLVFTELKQLVFGIAPQIKHNPYKSIKKGATFGIRRENP